MVKWGVMKYLFVSLAILAVWLGVIIMVGVLRNYNIMLPILALGITLVLFLIGFRRK